MILGGFHPAVKTGNLTGWKSPSNQNPWPGPNDLKAGKAETKQLASTGKRIGDIHLPWYHGNASYPPPNATFPPRNKGLYNKALLRETNGFS